MQLLLVKILSRNQKALDVQKVLTEHGCNIHLRLGLHEMTDSACSNQGVILLQVKPDAKAVKQLVKALKALKSVEVKSIEI